MSNQTEINRLTRNAGHPNPYDLGGFDWTQHEKEMVKLKRRETRDILLALTASFALALMVGSCVSKATAQAAYDAVNFETAEWRMP
ncbi:hypothetical protein [Halocynthiibacter styelae]|uniref:Uncharacterized protein n=1 Tax=Halocynthiibacter styelae TaxID=2761955 RepID=A0A8J7IIP8_9RHOB|nr:hypothetical protein [Paenihalocynthiibacter styelae]MBI1493433.1 hypothetical protein [Paenihalocynthiibacter styelae]